ncbi:MAG: hypothetical protein R6X13_10890 [bacterium]
MNGNVCIRTFSSLPEAESALDLLESEGIHAAVITEETPDPEHESTLVRLCVITDDAERAAAKLQPAETAG